MCYSQGMGSARSAGTGPYAGQNSLLRPHKVCRCLSIELEKIQRAGIYPRCTCGGPTRPKGLRHLPGNRFDTCRPSVVGLLKNSAPPNIKEFDGIKGFQFIDWSE